jgi:hypothetical protein
MTRVLILGFEFEGGGQHLNGSSGLVFATTHKQLNAGSSVSLLVNLRWLCV